MNVYEKWRTWARRTGREDADGEPAALGVGSGRGKILGIFQRGVDMPVNAEYTISVEMRNTNARRRMMFNREIGRQVAETVFGGFSRLTSLIVLAEIWEGEEDGTWTVSVDSGYLLTSLHSEQHLAKTFLTLDDAIVYAKSVSTEWRVKRGSWAKGNRPK